MAVSLPEKLKDKKKKGGRKMRWSFSIRIIFVGIVSIIFWGLSGGAVYGATVNPENQTEKFLMAVQKKDFKSIFDITYYYQMELSQIKSNNPKVLWQKLTTEYYESKKKVFFEKKDESLTDAWILFGGELFGTPTDPIENLRALMNLLTPSSKWKVIESRKEKHLDRWSGREYDVYLVYVSLGYKTLDESPLIGSKKLKEAILSFVLDAEKGLYMRSSRAVKGDVYWELPMRELQKLIDLIIDQMKQVLQIPEPKVDWRELITLKITGKYDDYSALYLMGINRRNLAYNACPVAFTFVTKTGDLRNAQKYADLATRHYIESNELFKAAEQVFSGSVGMTAQALEAIYRGNKEASKYGWYLMCGPKCYEVADYVFLMTDFAVDYGLEGIEEAKKNLVVSGFVKTLLKTGGVSKWIENRTTHLVGESGLYGVMDKTISSSEFQKAFMKVVAESGAYATKEMAETGVKTVINNSIKFIKGSSNLKPGN